MGWFKRNRDEDGDPPPVNTEFSVVTGDMRLVNGQILPFSAVVPTVFNGLAFPGPSVGNEPQREETVWMALEIANDTHPKCGWANEAEVQWRPATPDESAWALANGVNERFT